MGNGSLIGIVFTEHGEKKHIDIKTMKRGQEVYRILTDNGYSVERLEFLINENNGASDFGIFMNDNNHLVKIYSRDFKRLYHTLFAAQQRLVQVLRERVNFEENILKDTMRDIISTPVDGMN